MDAFYDYVRNLPEKKNKKSILSHLDINNPPTPDDIQDSIRQLEVKHGQKPSVKVLRRVLSPIVVVLKDYYGVLDTLTQADPTPSCIIWGTLKIVIDGLSRFIDLFERIQSELVTLNIQLRRLILYEDLYGQSTDMQEHLFRSYKNVFRFWCRVDKECNRNSLNALLRASASFSTKKLQSMIEDLKENADQIEKLAPIIEAQFAGDERAEAVHERYENKKERDEGSAWRQQMQSDRIRSWLGGQTLTESILMRHRSNLAAPKLGDTCDWLAHDTTYQSWTDGSLDISVLWLHAGPGSGKSTLCSYTINRIRQLEPKSAVALLFYEFDDSQRTALSTARALATQLFDYYWLQHQDVPEDLRTASQKSSVDLNNILDFVRLLVSKIEIAYIFVDGLDEECNVARWKEAGQIFDFLLLLANDWPRIVRLWYSTQDRPIIRTRLGNLPTMNIKEKIQTSVDEYISSTVPGINNPEVDQETRTWILAELKDRAKGNFLWTSLMLKTIEAEVSSFDEMEQFIKEGLPQDLDSYYSRIFARYEPRERELASKIFGLVTFAKRRLRLSELRQAIGILSSDEPRNLKTRSIPWRQAVERLFAPLIETQEDSDVPLDCFCYLFHSTVKTFLEQHPEVLQRTLPGAATLLINEFIIANACLLYLSQDTFAGFLIKDSDQWATASKEPMAGTSLLTYSAKYWDKHMDGIEETPELRLRIETFIRSGNFHTTLQLQSLFVEAHFARYTLKGCSDYHKYTKRVFPRWFARHSAEGCTDVARNYRSFTTQWSSFLCGCESIYGQFKGELDRCLWGALGPQNFLSRGQDRYSSFMLVDEDGLHLEDRIPYCAGISSDGSEAVVLKQIEVSNPGGVCPPYRTQSWALARCNHPRLLLEETIATDPDAKYAGGLDKPSSEAFRAKYSNSISLSPDLCCLSIGSRILVKDEGGRYSEIQGLDILTEDSPPHFEDVVLKNLHLILASREKVERNDEPRGRSRDKNSKISQEKGKPGLDLGSDLKATGTDCALCSREHSREPSSGSTSSPSKDRNNKIHEEDPSDRESTTTSLDAESSVWNSAEESWSEGSTSEDENDRALLIRLDSTSGEESETSESEGESDLESEGSAKDDASDAPIASHGQLLNDFERESEESNFEWDVDDSPYEADFDASDLDYRYESDDELGYDSDEQDYLQAFIRSRRVHKGAKTEQGLLIVYDLGADHPVQLFKFAHPLPIRLYNSPPVVHPSCPLVVWPLCGGDILFADYEKSSYFIRKMRPTTRKARQIFIKCHFSPCGKYLHIASFEARQKPLSRKERKAGTEDSLLISAFISTHRLSTRKITRCPPTLIHRMKFSVGEYTGLPSDRSPVEVTWTKKHVYFSSSSNTNQLLLFRVDLFASPKGQEDAAVCVPKKPILLPESARMREVYYFPPRAQDERALVLVGCLTNLKDKLAADGDATSEWDSLNGLPERVSPPIGFYLREEEDLGGWGPSNAVEEIGPDTAKGSLEQRMEKFSAEDDCDIEHYFIA